MVTMPLVEKATEPPRPAEPDPEVPAKAKHRVYSASYKIRVLNEYEGLSRAGKGALLRREGLYSSLIDAWRKQLIKERSPPSRRSADGPQLTLETGR